MGNGHREGWKKEQEKAAKRREMRLQARQSMPDAAQLPERAGPVQSDPSTWKKLINFVEQPIVTLPCGIVGGIVGTLYAPVLAVCGLCVVLGFHKAGVVAGRKLRVQIPVYMLIVFAITAVLYELHLKIQYKMREQNISLANMIIDRLSPLFPKQAPSLPSPNPHETPSVVAPPKPGVKALRPAEPSTTGYLRTLPTSIEFDPIDETTLWISFRTTNTGKLQVLPDAITIAYIRIRPEMSAAEEDKLFGTMNLEGGRTRLKPTERNYWEPGESKSGRVEGETEYDVRPNELTGLSTREQADLAFRRRDESIRKMKDGETNIYFFVRNGFADKLGWHGTESCFFYKGPNFTVFDCHGHNGPANWPK